MSLVCEKHPHTGERPPQEMLEELIKDELCLKERFLPDTSGGFKRKG